MKSHSIVQIEAPGSSAPARPSSRFPEDLREWIAAPALLRLSNGVAQEHTASALQPIFSMTATRFHHPWRMLTLLTYAFASGIWHARAIAEMASLDPSLVALFHGVGPSAEVVRRFRNQNRLPILRCQEQVLRRLWCHHHDQRVLTLTPLLSVEILCNARWRLQHAERSEVQTEEMNFQGG